MNTKRSTLACISPLVSLVPTFHRLTSNYQESYTTVFLNLFFFSICVCFSKFQRNKLPAKVTFWQVLLQTLPIGLVYYLLLLLKMVLLATRSKYQCFPLLCIRTCTFQHQGMQVRVLLVFNISLHSHNGCSFVCRLTYRLLYCNWFFWVQNIMHDSRLTNGTFRSFQVPWCSWNFR